MLLPPRSCRRAYIRTDSSLRAGTVEDDLLERLAKSESRGRIIQQAEICEKLTGLSLVNFAEIMYRRSGDY
jgi:hypothetical protein